MILTTHKKLVTAFVVLKIKSRHERKSTNGAYVFNGDRNVHKMKIAKAQVSWLLDVSAKWGRKVVIDTSVLMSKYSIKTL